MKTIFTFFEKTLATAILYLAIVSTAFAATGLAGTDNTGGDVGKFASGVLKFIDQILLPVILGLAFLAFVWGIFQFFILGGSDEEAQQKGKSLMMYAIAGFILILSFFGIVSVISNGLGLNHTSLDGADGVKTGFDVNYADDGHGN